MLIRILKKLSQFWSEDNGMLSCIRLHMSIITALTCWVVYYTVTNYYFDKWMLALVSLLLSYGCGIVYLKVKQKSIEHKDTTTVS